MQNINQFICLFISGSRFIYYGLLLTYTKRSRHLQT